MPDLDAGSGSDEPEVLARLLNDALGVMNEAIRIAGRRGGHAAMEHIADYLNNTDAVDEEVALGGYYEKFKKREEEKRRLRAKLASCEAALEQCGK